LLNEKGEAMVNSNFQLEGYPTIFCLGDIAAIRISNTRSNSSGLSQETMQALGKALSTSQPRAISSSAKEQEKGKEKGKDKKTKRKGKETNKKGAGPQAVQVLISPAFYKAEEKLAANAEKHAEAVIENVKALDRSEKMLTYKPSGRKLVISLGPQRAILVQESGSVTEGKGNVKARSLRKLRGFRFERSGAFV